MRPTVAQRNSAKTAILTRELFATRSPRAPAVHPQCEMPSHFMNSTRRVRLMFEYLASQLGAYIASGR